VKAFLHRLIRIVHLSVTSYGDEARSGIVTVRRYRILLALLTVLIMLGCRGQKSTKPPIHLVPNMDNQQKFRAFGENPFFTDKRGMRSLVEGTVPRGYLQLDDAYYLGMLPDSQFVDNPVELTMELLKRGQERFGIFCSVCHGLTGQGTGIVVKRGYTPAPSYTDERILSFKDGEIFNVISNGVRTMKGLGTQIPVDDRWAIVAYVRALQRSQNARLEDVPEDKRSELD